VRTLGRPRRHFRETGSTNSDAVALATAGAPHGTLVTAGAQHAGRGRQGREWTAPPGQALLMSVVLRSFDELLPLRAGLAAAEAAGPRALVKWPNDVLLDGRKVGGVLAEAFPRAGSAVVGVGINVAVQPGSLPPVVGERAGSLGRTPEESEDVLATLLDRLAVRLDDEPATVLAALRERDALHEQPVRWNGGRGVAAGLGDDGALLVRSTDGARLALRAAEIHLLGDHPPPR
jgi:BirA family biotin operon repressor/biotin-[acetyl-CoA-carboxylase] ligase